MHRSLDTIARQCSQFGRVTLARDETERYIPNLDREVKGYPHRPNSHASFTISQGEYIIQARVIYFSGTYLAIIHNMTKQDEHQKVSVPAPHRRRSA